MNVAGDSPALEPVPLNCLRPESLPGLPRRSPETLPCRTSHLYDIRHAQSSDECEEEAMERQSAFWAPHGYGGINLSLSSLGTGLSLASANISYYPCQ